nr:uncharacterized protein LOC101266593 [Solanum lycopersicum]
MVIPQQACWMIKKIMEARKFWAQDSGSNISGKRILREKYSELLEDRARIPWKATMFSNAAAPKIAFIIWVQLDARLLTNRLWKWGMEINPTCVLCNQEDKTQDHFFAHCEFTMLVWAKMLLWIQRQNPQTTNWNEHLQWVINSLKGKSMQVQVFKMVYADTVYALWNERNQTVFERKTLEPNHIVRRVDYICNVRSTTTVRTLIQTWLL